MTARAAHDDGVCRLGVLAFGDSITNGGGELQWGVALQSWALWTARALGVPYSPYAADGALARDVIDAQIPLFERVADQSGRYLLGCLYVGTNDVRRPGFDPEALERDHAAALAFLGRRCEHLLTLTLPLDLGRPREPSRVRAANHAIASSAARHGAHVLDLSRFGGRGVMMADHVHPTALGQVRIAELALELLRGRTGLEPRVRPGELVTYRTTRRSRLRADLTYAYRHAKQDLSLLARSRRHR